MKIVKKFAAAALCLMLLLSAVSVISFADNFGSFTYSTTEPEKDEDFEPYNVVSRYSRDDTDTNLAVIIPDYIDKVPTKVIAASAFKNDSVTEEYIIPDTVETIGNSAFAGCTALKVVVIPDTVKEIGYSAFQGCTALEYVVIGSGVKTVGSLAFKDCSSLKHLKLGSGLEKIESGAFYNCTSLTDIAVPDSLTEIGSMALGYYDEGDTRQAVPGVSFYMYSDNAALDKYVFDSKLSSQSGVALPAPQTIAPCADGSHELEFELVRAATDEHVGMELGVCGKCFDIISKDNTDIPEEPESASGMISLIIGVIAAAAFAALIVVYVRRSKARRAEAIAAYARKNEKTETEEDRK